MMDRAHNSAAILPLSHDHCCTSEIRTTDDIFIGLATARMRSAASTVTWHQNSTYASTCRWSGA